MNTLFLTSHQIPLGATVYVCTPGSDKPEADEHGNLLPPLTCLLGGVPIREKLYLLTQQERFEGGAVRLPSFEIQGWQEGTLFIPAESFSTENAPVRQNYAVYTKGNRLKYNDYPEYDVVVAKTSGGEILSVNGYARRHYRATFIVPRDAVLVPIGGFDFNADFDLLLCIGIPNLSDADRAVLEAKGVVFYVHAPYKPDKCVDYVGVALPDGWRRKEESGWYKRRPYCFHIYDTEGCVVASIVQEPADRIDEAWKGVTTLG